MRRTVLATIALAVAMCIGGSAFAENADRGSASGFALGIRIGEFILSLGQNASSDHSRAWDYGRNWRDLRRAEEIRLGGLIYTLRYSRDDNEREDAAKALGKLKAQRAVNALIEALICDKDDDVREEAAIALGKIGSREAVQALRRAAHNDRSRKVRKAAEKALGEILRDTDYYRDGDRDDRDRDADRGDRDRDPDRERDRDRDRPYRD